MREVRAYKILTQPRRKLSNNEDVTVTEGAALLGSKLSCYAKEFIRSNLISTAAKGISVWMSG